jgi:hypothetical protein
MAKVHLDRLQDRYGWSGEKYQELMATIIAENHISAQRAVGRKLTGYFAGQANKIKPQGNARLLVPDLTDVLPKRSVYFRKGAEQGKLLTDTVRTDLAKNLKAAMAEYLGQGNEKMQYQIGDKKSMIKPKLIAQFEKAITATFQGYTKGKAPANIHAIAVTEIRSAISDVKHLYAQRLANTNPGKVRMLKRWRHNPALSAVGRMGHRLVDGQTIAIAQAFLVPRYYGGQRIGVTAMDHPHDSRAPADQVISCNCECQYIVEIL